MGIYFIYFNKIIKYRQFGGGFYIIILCKIVHNRIVVITKYLYNFKINISVLMNPFYTKKITKYLLIDLVTLSILYKTKKFKKKLDTSITKKLVVNL